MLCGGCFGKGGEMNRRWQEIGLLLAWVLWTKGQTIGVSRGLLPPPDWGPVDAWETKAQCEEGKRQYMKRTKHILQVLGMKKIHICTKEDEAATTISNCWIGTGDVIVYEEPENTTVIQSHVCFPESVDPRQPGQRQ